MKIIVYYNEHGYRIENNLDGEVLYEAGNSPLNRQPFAAPKMAWTLKQ